VPHRFFVFAAKGARRVFITIAGIVVILAGVAMLVLPGPGILTIIAGLVLLGTEFDFARRWVSTLKNRARKGVKYARQRLRPPGPPPAPPRAP
jgi:drug/metabolite transporter (DMT)-like permease